MEDEKLQGELKRFLGGEGFYKWGVELLKDLRHDSDVVKRLAVYCRMDYAPNAAEAELWDILRGYEKKMSPIKTLQRVEKETVINSQDKKSSTKASNLPPIVQGFQDKKVMLLKLRADWHTRMKVTEKQTDRAYCAEMVLSVQGDLERVYAVLDNYFEHGIEPIEVIESEQNVVVDLVKSKGNLASRISKIRALLKNEGLIENRKVELRTELAEKELRLKDVLGKIQSV